MSFESSVKQRVRSLRQALGLSQSQLAERLSTSNQHIGRLERADSDAHLSLEWVERLADGLDVGVEQLLFDQSTNSDAPRFEERTLPHRGLARCGPAGWGKPTAHDPLPAPADLLDPSAFYVRASGQSMQPEGIEPGDEVLVGPSSEPSLGDRVYVEDLEERGSLKRLVRASDSEITLRGWLREGTQFKEFFDTRRLDYLSTFAPVLAVYAVEPRPGERAVLRPDPRMAGPSISLESETLVLPTADGFSLIARYQVSASAGSGLSVLDEEVIESLAFKTDWLRRIGIDPAQSGLIQAHGDSMSPTISDGALMLVDMREDQPIRHGCIYVILRDGDLIVKRVDRSSGDGSVDLVSDNKRYKKQTVTIEELADMRIPGRVVWVGKAL